MNPGPARAQNKAVTAPHRRKRSLNFIRLRVLFYSLLFFVLIWNGAPAWDMHALAATRTKKSKRSATAPKRNAPRTQPSAPPPTKKSLAALDQERQALRSKIQKRRRERDHVKKREMAVASKIKQNTSKLRQEEHSLKKTKAHLNYLGQRQRAVQDEKDSTRRQLESHRRVLADHIRWTYERQAASAAQFLLPARRLQDSFSLGHYAASIMDRDVQQITRTKGHHQLLTEQMQKLETRAGEQKAVRADLEYKIQKDRTTLSSYRSELVKVQETLQEIEEDMAQMEVSSRLIEEQIRSAQWARRQQGAARAWLGSFIQPVQGLITSHFGMRYHPILYRWLPHNGIDIAASHGSAIRAAADGEVIFAGYIGGYGHSVILDHGGEVSTLYAHCSALLVSKGQPVKQGQTIARVGQSGRATGPHLHFEERRNGTPVDPLRHVKH